MRELRVIHRSYLASGSMKRCSEKGPILDLSNHSPFSSYSLTMDSRSFGWVLSCLNQSDLISDLSYLHTPGS